MGVGGWVGGRGGSVLPAAIVSKAACKTNWSVDGGEAAISECRLTQCSSAFRM